MAVYLRLFHGRKHPDEELDDWGSDGPVFGPLDYVHTTYACHIKLGVPHHADLCELFLTGDMVYYDGVWYGDWTVFGRKELIADKFKATKFDPKKAELPREYKKKSKVQPA